LKINHLATLQEICRRSGLHKRKRCETWTGWPDGPNFRPFDECLLWAVFIQLH
jgi:hypothetical protein